MIKKTVIEIPSREVLEIGGAHAIDMDHKRDERSPTGTGIRPIFNGFYDEKRNQLRKEVVTERILKYLRDRSIIDTSKRWRLDYKPDHSWSWPDDDGNRHSVYTVDVIVYCYEDIKEVTS